MYLIIDNTKNLSKAYMTPRLIQTLDKYHIIYKILSKRIDVNEVINNLRPNKKKMLELAEEGHITATDLADYMVRELNYPFRKAYLQTAKIINFAEKNKKKLNQLKIEEIKKIEPKLNSDVFKVFDLKYSINSKTSFGGTSFVNIKKMIRSYKKDL